METKYCQSCGMPMEGQEYGTNKDGSESADYCKYCYDKGEFTAQMSMDEMIEFCVGPMAEANPEMEKEQARKMMGEFFPTLKRWCGQVSSR